MKIHHWLLALLVFYVTVAAMPDARMVWSLDGSAETDAVETIETELPPERRELAQPTDYEVLLLLDLATLSNTASAEADISEMTWGEG